MDTPPALASSSSTELNLAADARLLSLDVFRGLVIAGMILVTDPGTYAAIYWSLRHAEWQGWTPTDIISPAFLLAIGIAIPFSSPTRQNSAVHILRRTLLLILLGLLVNGFSDYDRHTLRHPGILQHIAVSYFAAAMVYLTVRRSVRRTGLLALAAGLPLAIYWTLIKLYPVPGFGSGRVDTIGSIAAYVDRVVFTIPHLWQWGLTPGHGVTFDPDGLLSTLGTLPIMLIGCLAGEWLQSTDTRPQKAAVLATAAVLLIVAGRASAPCMPLIKKLWTPTFAVFSSGAALLIFAALYFIVDILRWRAWAMPARIFGTNAILAFVLSSAITALGDRIHTGAGLTIHRWAYDRTLATGLSPLHASLAYAIAIVLLNLALIYPFYRQRVFFRL